MCMGGTPNAPQPLAPPAPAAASASKLLLGEDNGTGWRNGRRLNIGRDTLRAGGPTNNNRARMTRDKAGRGNVSRRYDAGLAEKLANASSPRAGKKAPAGPYRELPSTGGRMRSKSQRDTIAAKESDIQAEMQKIGTDTQSKNTRVRATKSKQLRKQAVNNLNTRARKSSATKQATTLTIRKSTASTY